MIEFNNTVVIKLNRIKNSKKCQEFFDKNKFVKRFHLLSYNTAVTSYVLYK